MKKIFLSIVVLVFLTSCEKFLNVTPDNLAYEEDLFKDRSGFEAALAGAYTSMNKKELFGKELKYGFMETLSSGYNTPGSTHEYYRSFRHEYSYPIPTGMIESIWGESYKVINQYNIILENLDQIKSDPYYQIIKGEALAGRAFMHLHLLKLFGPVIKQEGLGVSGIPYKDKVAYKGGAFETAGQVIEKLNEDLEAAKSLLEKDPIRENARNANLNLYGYERYNSLLDYRGTRFNYYAVIALQALVAQWEGDLPKARTFAEELIAKITAENSSFHLATPGELSGVGNIRLPMENIFALISQNLLNDALIVHPTIEDARSLSTSPILAPAYTFLLNNLYNAPNTGSLNDYRLLNWFGRNGTTGTAWKLVKYIFNPTYLVTNPTYKPLYENKILNLHTIYMIAAEEYAESNPSKAIQYLNKVRNSRNVTNDISYTSSMTTTAIKTLIFDEMRKDNIDEGYMWTEYKRQFKAIDRATAVQPSLGIFKLPIPADELLYNPQI